MLDMPELPDFLVYTPAVAAQSAVDWAKLTPRPMQTFAAPKRDLDEATRAFAEQEASRAKIKTTNRIAKLVASKVDRTGMRWDTNKSRWVPDPFYRAPVKADGLVRRQPVAAPAREVRAAPAVRAPAKSEKHGILLTMLERKEGATLDELAKATGWMPHSCGARISGYKTARTVTKTKEPRGTVYRISK